MLFVYFIDELPEPLTMRSFLEFLNQKLVVEKEQIPCFRYALPAAQLSSFEFCGFIRGATNLCYEASPELDKEIIELNKIAVPPDDELAALLDQENAGGCQLIQAAQYSGILPGGENQSETLLDDEGWEELERRNLEMREKEKKKKKKQSSTFKEKIFRESSDESGSEDESKRKSESGEKEELPEEYVELMRKEKKRQRKLKEKKDQNKRRRQIRKML